MDINNRKEEIISTFKDAFSFIEYDDPSHTYTWDGKPFTPVTTEKKKYLPNVNWEFMARKTAISRGVTVQEIKDLWHFNKVKGGTRGSTVHNYIENFLQEIDEDVVLDPWVHTLTEKQREEYIADIHTMIGQFSDYYEDHPHLVPVLSEYQVADKDMLVAGTIDQIFLNTDTGKLEIWDWKTNKQFTDGYGKKLKKPFNKFKATKLNEFSVQLNLYKYMIEKNTDFEIDDLKIAWFVPTNDKYTILECEDFQEILKEHYG